MALFKNKFDSAKQEWTTPQGMFDKLNLEFDFNFDLAADATNSKCKRFFSKEENSLSTSWEGRCWLNPPYGSKKDKLSEWVKKAYSETAEGKCELVVMLIPARTNCKWWHHYVMKADEVKFVCGRPKFGDAKHGLPQPLALIVFRDGNLRRLTPKFSSFYL